MHVLVKIYLLRSPLAYLSTIDMLRSNGGSGQQYTYMYATTTQHPIHNLLHVPLSARFVRGTRRTTSRDPMPHASCYHSIEGSVSFHCGLYSGLPYSGRLPRGVYSDGRAVCNRTYPCRQIAGVKARTSSIRPPGALNAQVHRTLAHKG